MFDCNIADLVLLKSISAKRSVLQYTQIIVKIQTIVIRVNIHSQLSKSEKYSGKLLKQDILYYRVCCLQHRSVSKPKYSTVYVSVTAVIRFAMSAACIP